MMNTILSGIQPSQVDCKSIWRRALATPYGPLDAVWSSSGLFACSFSGTLPCPRGWHLADGADETIEGWHRELVASFEQYFAVGSVEWDLSRLDWRDVTPFRVEVLRHCFEIPAGATLTYGQLAARVGRPAAARAVGSAMASNRWPVLIPCHRVVGAGGSLVGYSGTGGLQTKHRLLEWERRCAAAV